MKRTKSAIKALPRCSHQEAEEQGYTFFIDGKPCKNGHTPTIRLTKNGWCEQCYDDYRRRRMKADLEKKQKLAFKPKIYIRFKRRDGTYLIEGPYTKRQDAITRYKRIYEQEYGQPCPPHYF